MLIDNYLTISELFQEFQLLLVLSFTSHFVKKLLTGKSVGYADFKRQKRSRVDFTVPMKPENEAFML